MTSGWARRSAAAARITAAMLAGCGALALSACEQRAEPRPAYAAAPPPPPAPLAGEPESAPSAAPPGDATAPPQETGPSLAPPEPAPQAPPPSVRDEGLVAMAPIPNPEDGGPALQAAPPHRPLRHAAEPPPRRFLRHRPHAAAAHRPTPAAPPRPSPSRQSASRASAPSVARRPAAKPPAHAAPLPPSKRTPTHRERRATRAELQQGKAASNAGASNTTGARADARTEALRSALSAAVARGAVLAAPKASADQAAEVTLTLPASFYDTVKTEAGRQAMGDAAASANAEAVLTGDGYAIIPGGAQAQPLRVGQPTAFRWTVTAPAGAKGPLRADVSVDLLGGGSQTLALGAVDAAKSGDAAPRWWGAALLALVLAVGLWWLLRNRSADARIAASRRRAKRPDGTVNGQRPLDLRPTDDGSR